MEHKGYLDIVAACEADLAQYGDTFLGMGWTKRQEDADTRYRVMLEVVRAQPGERITLLDFGCGASHLYEYMRKHGMGHIDYGGLDLSEKYLAFAKRKFPTLPYYHLDVLDDDAALPTFDYVVMNGIFNYKGDQSYDEMLAYFRRLLSVMFAKSKVGLAFNVMSKQVDWERDDLFHLPFDEIASFLTKHLSRHFVIRHDYGLYEYTVYLYR